MQSIPLILPDNTIQYFNIEIKPSIIKGAGLGIFSKDIIPKNCKTEYTGQFIKQYDDNTPDNYNIAYSWTILKWKKNGDPIDGQIYGYLDAFDKKYSNWTRYVNCPVSKQLENMEMEQKYDKIYYKTKRIIYPNEELFIDYGDGYREVLQIDDNIYNSRFDLLK